MSDAPQSSTQTVSDHSLLRDDNGRNSSIVLCPNCDSVILRPFSCQYSEEREILLPAMFVRKGEVGEKTAYKQYWLVKDKFDFDNIGFTNVSDGAKYLICSDCEIGPLGFHDQITGVSYLAVQLVKYK